jgi:hypothetical protein
MVQPGQFDTAPEDIRKLAYEESSLADAGYLLRVTHEISQAVRMADSARTPAHLGFGFGEEGRAAFNRRMRMKNGQTWTMPGLSNPDIVGYAGPIDPQVGVIGAWDLDGKLLGTLVNFSCHATTNPGGISANWIYYLERAIQGALVSRAPVVFRARSKTNGDSRDGSPLSPRDATSDGPLALMKRVSSADPADPHRERDPRARHLAHAPIRAAPHCRSCERSPCC